MIGARPDPPRAAAETAGILLAEHDRLLMLVVPIHDFLRSHRAWADGLLIASSFVIDVLSLFLLSRGSGATEPPESVTRSVTEDVPELTGVPETPPVELLMLSPAGSPFAKNVYGSTPPVAETLPLYPNPTPPAGNAAVMVSSPMIGSERVT